MEAARSASSVFSVISTWVKENSSEPEGAGSTDGEVVSAECSASRTATHAPIQPDEVERLRAMTRLYLVNNIRQMRDRVVPELQEEARALLCDYWGESFVALAENSLAETEKPAEEPPAN